MDDKRQPHTNGSLKGPTASKGANGHVSNGDVSNSDVPNGHASKGPVSKGPVSPVAPPRSKTSKKRRGFFASYFNVVARLLTWYSIFTILFRCPASLDACDETSARICKPYFHAKHLVTPHVSPYYDAYAAPYVSLARPYYDTLDRNLITPGRTYAVRYGGPRVAQVQAYGHAQWEKNVQPQILKYQAEAKAKYDDAVSPYVDSAVTTFAPYYDIARTNALQTYHEILVPTYTFLRPYATRGYEVAYAFTNDAIIPSTVWVWNKTYAFLDSAVWPHVRDVYVLKVEPQLVRIGERLGRYNEQKPKPIVEGTEPVLAKSTFTKPTPSVSSTTYSATEEPTQTASRAPNTEYSRKPEVPLDTQSKTIETPKTKEEIRELAAKTVAEDLELWQGKFTQVAEEGASEIEDRVDDISARMIQHHANTMGKSLVKQLEATVQSELGELKKSIINVLENGKNDPEERDEKVASAVRSAGLAIKNKAQNIRDWRHSYEQETEIAVTKAVEEHFSILEQTRDLALQKIGMKWAWMDGVTYKDWQNYHQLKDRFEEWIQDFKHLITTHPGLTAAQTAGTDIEDEGMAIAHEAAVELGRLKQVATWKAVAEDFTDDFDSETMQLAAEAAERRIAEAVVNQAVTGDDTETESSGDIESSVVSPEDASVRQVVESPANERTNSDRSPESSSTSDAKSADEATSAAASVEPLPSSDPIDGPEQMEETILESSDLPIHSIVEQVAPTTVKSALFGAAAESVPTRQPVFDDDSISSAASSVLSVAGSAVPASIASTAHSAYTAAIARAADQYSRAMSAVSVQVSGEPKPAHEEMFSSVSNGYFSAVAAANSQLDEAVTAVSKGLYGTPTTKWSAEMPTVPSVDWERVQSIAHQRLQDSVNWASEQYESAKVAIGAAEPTPSTYLEEAEQRAQKLLDQAKHNYFAGVGIAHARYSEFLSAASTAVSSLTATPTPTNIQESASSVVSVAGEAAEAVVSSAGDVARDVKSSFDENWNLLVSRVSSEVYGAPTPTPWYENMYAAAGDYASQADDLVVSATEVIVDQISIVSSIADEYAASAQSAASSQYDAVSSLVSELIHGKEPSFTESVYQRLAQAYTTGLSSASSIGSVVSATAVSAASKVSDAAGSRIEEVAEGVAAVTDKVKDTVDHIKDEL
ncbi:hypothetical protein F5Y14DRAFT_405036 [Nemania sp. NC0429]|nr:hypothetical protein F5Y14DRAFT_405036 [Nemania sp. NC0429]